MKISYDRIRRYHSASFTHKVVKLDSNLDYDPNTGNFLFKDTGQQISKTAPTREVDLLMADYSYGDAIRPDSKSIYLSPDNA